MRDEDAKAIRLVAWHAGRRWTEWHAEEPDSGRTRCGRVIPRRDWRITRTACLPGMWWKVCNDCREVLIREHRPRLELLT